MESYAKECRTTVIPGVYYRDPDAMIEWLCETFGFQKQLLIRGPNNAVMHAQLTFGNGMIMVGPVKSGTSTLIHHPDEGGGAATQVISLIVSDCTDLYSRAKSAGAKVLSELETREFGGEAFSCSDPEGYVWYFGTHDPWEAAPA